MPRATRPAFQAAHVAAMLTAVVVTLTSCGGQPRLAMSEESPAATTAPSFQPAAAPATPVNRRPTIGEIIWTSATEPGTNEPIAAVDSFPADADGIIATARGDFLPIGATVNAAWSYNNTPLEPFSTRLVIEGALEERWLSFRLDRDPDVLWPTGRYEVTISLDNEEAQRASVEVTAPS